MWALYLLLGAMCGASVTVVLMGCLAAGARKDRELEAFRAGYRRARNQPPTRSEDVAASSLDRSTRDVPPIALDPAEKVEQPAQATKRAANRTGGLSTKTPPAAERTPPLPLDDWTADMMRGVTPT